MASPPEQTMQVRSSVELKAGLPVWEEGCPCGHDHWYFLLRPSTLPASRSCSECDPATCPRGSLWEVLGCVYATACLARPLRAGQLHRFDRHQMILDDIRKALPPTRRP